MTYHWMKSYVEKKFTLTHLVSGVLFLVVLIKQLGINLPMAVRKPISLYMQKKIFDPF